MRVTFILPKYGWHPSGGFRVVYTYAGLLASRGHQVTVVHPRRLPAGGWPEPKGIMQRARRMAARARDAAFRPRLGWADPAPDVRMLYVPEITAPHVPDGDAVIATWWSTAEAVLRLPSSKGERYHLIQGYESWAGAEARVESVWRSPIHKIVIARWLLDRARELRVPDRLLTHIPNAVSLDVFRVREPIEDRPPRVAMLHSSEWYKGGALGLEMLKRAKIAVPQLKALLFGVRAAPSGLLPWISYVRGASPETLSSEVYNRSAVYLCPSLSEGWHLPSTEAMACGCAVVSSDIGGVYDYAEDGVTALLYPAGNVAAGTDRLVRALTDEPLRVALARAGHGRIAGFSWQRSADLLEALLSGSTSSAAPTAQLP
jgi:glycosyltransferase involved in cell wall biosynthesis